MGNRPIVLSNGLAIGLDFSRRAFRADRPSLSTRAKPERPAYMVDVDVDVASGPALAALP